MKSNILEGIYYLCSVANLYFGLTIIGNPLAAIAFSLIGLLGCCYGLSKLYYTLTSKI